MEKEQDNNNFERIRDAIGYINNNFKSQPGLEEIADHLHLSPSHFQRIFTEWAGVSPKKFLQYISVSHAKSILQNNQASLFDTAYEVGLSGTGRLHDLFINIEGMTPGEYKNGGGNLSINYNFERSPFGKIIIASTPKGVCYMGFAEDEQQVFGELLRLFPNARYTRTSDPIQKTAVSIFEMDWNKLEKIKLHVKGTDFQLKVWETLLKIPSGKLTTYGDIAKSIDNPKASRAVGSAVGDNPVSFIIPCHRVIRSTGIIGEYHWGSSRKSAMIGWEKAAEDRRLKK